MNFFAGMAEGVNPGWILSGLGSRAATASTPQIWMGFPQVDAGCGNGMGTSTLSFPISRENQTFRDLPLCFQDFAHPNVPEFNRSRRNTAPPGWKRDENGQMTSKSRVHIHFPPQNPTPCISLHALGKPNPDFPTASPQTSAEPSAKDRFHPSYRSFGDTICLPDGNQLDSPTRRQRKRPRAPGGRGWSELVQLGVKSWTGAFVSSLSLCTWSSGIVPARRGWREPEQILAVHTEHRAWGIFGMFGNLGALPSS